jgi:NDP-sugar pyrophosphorylase family protein
MTVERPKALLPLVNVPMIDYTLEWLIMNGVEEVCSIQYSPLLSLSLS